MEELTTRTVPEALVSVTPVRSGALEEIHVSLVPADAEASPIEQTRAMYTAMLDRILMSGRVRIVAERVFGRLTAKSSFLSTRETLLRSAALATDTPVTYLEGTPVDGGPLAGAQLTLVRTDSDMVRVSPLREGDVVYGFCVTAGDVQRVYLPGMHGLEDGGELDSVHEQARRMFERTNRLLLSAGMRYRQVVCTRIYLKDILDWYDAFNTVRNPFHERVGLVTADGRPNVPASTGIQGKLSDVCACFMDVTAVADGRPCPFVKLRNPLQNEATDYGSSFARGVRLDVPGARHVIISGTASIDETGATVHLGNPLEQTRRTMRNFEAILAAGGASVSDLYHAVWYVKAAAYAEIVRDEMTRSNWPAFPFVFVKADVCRGDLLVEIDGAAVLADD